MLLNPNVQGDEGVEKLSADSFDRPIPGQSLTGTPKSHPWETPPEITDVDDAFMFIIDKVKGSPKVQKGYDKVITMGMPLESICNTITFGGFVEGMWTVDIAELLKPPVLAFLMLYYEEKGLPYIPYNNDDSSDKTNLDDMSPYDFFETMKENNPEAHGQIGQAMEAVVEEYESKNRKIESMKNSFLVDMPMVEEGMPMPEGGMPMVEEGMPMPEENIMIPEGGMLNE